MSSEDNNGGQWAPPATSEPTAVSAPIPEPAVPAPAVATPPTVYSISVDYRDRVCYALAYNRVPTIKSITVRNELGAISGQLTISAHISWTAAALQPMVPTEVVVNAPPRGDAVEIKGDSFKLVDEALVDLSEEAAGTLVVTVTDAMGNTATQRLDIRVLARNQWLSGSDVASITAAFVQPNHPVVNDVLALASSVLMKTTGSSALEGYQSGPERAVQIGRAIFEALQQRIDRYVNPPASFAEEGQKLRPLDEVLEYKQGTCIDLACAYASCLEQAGLNPFVILVHSHAFTGFLVKDVGTTLPAVLDDFTTLITLLDAGALVCAETTVLAGDGGFDEARQATRRHFAERATNCPTCEALIASGVPVNQLPHVEWAVNITRCHADGVLPLPARVVRNGIVMVVIDNGPTMPPIVERRDEKTHKLLPNTVPARVQQWKNSLLDLSFRNPLLNYRPAKTGLELLAPTKVLHELEDHLISGTAIQIQPSDELSQILQQRGFRAAQDLGDADFREVWQRSRGLFAGLGANQFDTRIRNIRSKAKSDEQEAGVNNLYLTLGMLRWNDPKSNVAEVKSPIFLVPIRVTTKRGSRVVSITADESATTSINYCLIEALRARRGMKLSWFSEDMADGFGLDIERGLQEIRSELLEQNLTKVGFEVIDEASIGFLRFSKLRLWRDLDENWELFSRNAIVEHLVEGRRGQHFLDPADPEGVGVGAVGDTTLLNPQPADGAQSRAITRALAGQSFVLEGPPGTGKSQTITNLLANALANGKRVLFVAEKQAALSVVKERLDEVGLSPFCLDLHDKGSSPADIKSQLKQALEFQPAANMSLWDSNSERFDAAARFLAAYRDKLHGTNIGGTSYYGAYSRLLEIGVGPVATVTRKLFNVDAERIALWRRMLTDIESFSEPAKPVPGHPWAIAGAISFDEVDRVALGQLITALQRSIAILDSSSEPWKSLVESTGTFDELVGLAALMRAAQLNAAPSSEHWRAILTPGWASGVQSIVDRMATALTSVNDLVQALGTDFLMRDDSNMLAAVTAATESFAIGRKGRIRTALGPLASTPPFSQLDPKTVVAAMQRMVAASRSIRSDLGALVATPGLTVPPQWTPTTADSLEQLRERINVIHDAAQLLAADGELARGAATAAAGLKVPADEHIAAVRSVATTVRAIAALLRGAEQEWNRWVNGRAPLDATRASLPIWSGDLDTGTWTRLNRWLSFAAVVRMLDDDSTSGFQHELLTGVISGTDALAAFDRALMQVTLEVVGEEMALDTFERTSHDRRVNDFIALLRERQNLLRKVIPHMLYSSRTFSAGANAGEVAQLRTELNSNRRGARSVRSLIARYPQLIAGLTPCFLMSPDSIAKFIQPGKLEFDLVVFDEASQIPVASAVGALGRATAAVIVGDSRQMPPTSVGVAGSGGDDDDDAAPVFDEEAVLTDAESILDECLESGLDQEWLAWHYRSKDELLIKFSNDKYYNQRLASFPSPFQKVPECGIEYHRVNGQFDHGGKKINPIEADAIVAEVRRRANDPALKAQSIGIVTMNLQQRELIEQRLRDLNDKAVAALLDSEDDAENLFVLNLESVQGRERDVIILGTSFSPKAGGGRTPHNFGPLIQTGGERRLNVAVTRARRLVVVFSSFDPEDLSDARSVGLRHLYEYLKLAQAVSQGQRPEASVGSPAGDDRHRAQVATALRERGLIVETGVGLSSFKVDLAVTLPGYEDRRLVGVLLDGEVWASRELVLDRDALPTTVLQNLMGWPRIVRVWLPAWRHDHDEIVSDIYEAAIAVSAAPVVATPPAAGTTLAPPSEATVAEAPEGLIVPPPPTLGSPTIASAPTTSIPAEERPYVAVPSRGIVGQLYELEARSPKARQMVREFAEQYGPISLTVAVKLVANAFDLGRVSDKRVAEFSVLADPANLVTTEFGDFLFPADLVDGTEVRSEFTWYRRSTSQERDVREIAPHEVANLLRSIVRQSFAIDRKDLATEALSVLGYTRKKAETMSYVDQLIMWAVEHEYITLDGTTVRL